MLAFNFDLIDEEFVSRFPRRLILPVEKFDDRFADVIELRIV